jgi:hypothetical protein
MKEGLMEKRRIMMKKKKMMVVRFLGRCNVSSLTVCSACSHTLTHCIAFALYLLYLSGCNS